MMPIDIFLVTIESQYIKYELWVNGINLISNYTGEIDSSFYKINPVTIPGNNKIELRLAKTKIEPKSTGELPKPKFELKFIKAPKGQAPTNDSLKVFWTLEQQLEIENKLTEKQFSVVYSKEFESTQKYVPTWAKHPPVNADASSIYHLLQTANQLLINKDATNFVNLFKIKLDDATESLELNPHNTYQGFYNSLIEEMKSPQWHVPALAYEDLRLLPEAGNRIYKVVNKSGEPLLVANPGKENIMPFELSVAYVGNQWVIAR